MAFISMASSARFRSVLSLLIILTATFAVGFVGAQGSLRGLDFWYIALNKPAWNPPGFVFAPVWTGLYVMMSVAAWQVWNHPDPSPRRTWGLVVYGFQLVLNGLWPWLFFAFGKLAVSFVEILILLATLVLNAVLFAGIRRSAAWLFLPYLLWVTFAACLNFAIWRLNR